MRSLCPAVRIALTLVAGLAAGFAATPARAQDDPHLLRAEPGGLVVSPASGDIEILLLGDNLWDADRLWTERNVRLYARQTAGGDWVRLFTGTGDVGQGSFEDATPAIANGRVVESGPERYRVTLPAGRWLDRKGAIEFKIVRGVWRRAGENRWRFQDAAASNVLRLPVAEAPHRPPDLQKVSPERLPARADGPPPTLWVRAADLTLDARIAVGGEDCPLTRLDASLDFAECRVPETILQHADTYGVTVTTGLGASTGTVAVTVVAPPAIARLAPQAIPAKGTDALVVVRFTGGEPDAARMRRVDRGGWTSVPLRPLEPGALRLEIPASLRGFAGEIEVELENLAGASRGTLALCADEGPSPLRCSWPVDAGGAPAIGVAQGVPATAPVTAAPAAPVRSGR